VRRHAKNIALIAISVFLLLASLWQLEIVEIACWEHRTTVDLPFFIASLNVWLYRDILFLVIVLAYFMLFAALWYWED